ncbi:MAG: nucleotidyltransferase domain-containing protein [Caulobacterales bacterium]
MTETETQLAIIGGISDALAQAKVRWWLFGGWGMDAHVGRITRDHHDIEFWVELVDAAATRAAMLAWGFEAIATQPPEESQEFEQDGLRFSSAFFVRTPDGFAHPQGRWTDWRFPLGSFGDKVGTLGARAVPVMSVEGMLAMKTQYATLRHGRPLRPKDVADMVVLTGLLRK